MENKRITISVSPELQDWLEQASKTSGKSISHIARHSLEEFIRQFPDHFSRSTNNESTSKSSWEIRDKSLDDPNIITEVYPNDAN